MPEMLASHTSQRIAALLDFRRDVDLMSPSHVGKSTSTPGHHRTHRGGDSWPPQKSWSDSLGSFLSRASKMEVPAPPRPIFRVEPDTLVTLSAQGQFSPAKFIRNVLKRALGESRDDQSAAGSLSTLDAKRARTTPFVDCVGYLSDRHAMDPMVLCG